MMSILFRSLSLGFRCAANNLAGHILGHILGGAVSRVSVGVMAITMIPMLVVLVGYELVVAVIQSLVYAVLMSTYIGS